MDRLIAVCRKAPAVLAAALALAAASAIGGEQAPDTVRIVEARALRPGQAMATGRIVSLRTATVGPEVAGRIVSMAEANGRPLDAGSKVEKGQELWQQDTEACDLSVAQAGAALARAEAAMADLKAWVRPEKREAIAAEVRRLEATAADAEKDLGRFKRLAAEKSAPERRAEEAQLRLDSTRAMLDAARAQLKEAEAGPTPTAVKLAEAQVAEAKVALSRAEKDKRDATVRAPFSGVVTARMKGVGDYLNKTPLTEVLELVSLDDIEADLSLPEAYLSSVRAGTPATLRSDLLAEAVTLPVTAVTPQVRPQTGTFAFRVRIPPEKRGGLAPGAFVKADVQAGDGKAGGVAVPQGALFAEGGETVVYRVGDDGRLARLAVRVGARLTGEAIVETGLSPGDRLAVAPPGTLKDGMLAPAKK